MCGAAAETNALFGGVARTAKHEIAKLAVEEVSCSCDCATCKRLQPKKTKGTLSDDDVRLAFDGQFETRWVTEETQAANDLDNGKIRMRFLGDVHVCHVDIAWFDGHLANPLFSMYKRSAKESKWSNILDKERAAKTEAFQKFQIDEHGVNTLSLVGRGSVNTHANGTEIVNLRSKFSEVKVYGC